MLPETELETERELALQEALAISSMYKRGNSDEVENRRLSGPSASPRNWGIAGVNCICWRD